MKLLTLNLRHDDDRWDERFSLVVDVLHGEQADVVALQEVCLPIEQAHVIAGALNARRPERPYTVYLAPKWGKISYQEGVAILTRLPAVSYARLELPEENRVAQRLSVLVDGRAIHIANTHLHHLPFEDESIRLPQMKALLAWMFEHAARGWLLVGDMNAEPASSTVAEARRHLRSAYRTLHGEEPVTFPTPLSAEWGRSEGKSIDYIFFDATTLRAAGVRRAAHRAHPEDAALYPSDHYALVAEIEPVEEAG